MNIFSRIRIRSLMQCKKFRKYFRDFFNLKENILNERRQLAIFISCRDHVSLRDCFFWSIVYFLLWRQKSNHYLNARCYIGHRNIIALKNLEVDLEWNMSQDFIFDNAVKSDLWCFLLCMRSSLVRFETRFYAIRHWTIFNTTFSKIWMEIFIWE